ncbi:Similar to hypothetical protein [Tuber melanosporum Mel28]; acc. no. XP_002840073 [Pyronema omphalodes CBS 100304]|uniref:BAH domain-containing protein n=1 Tax=Pyronema omphalodes (strain CBS 100304) TaxID=1076935 RepID=U4LF62_PYROM|nr:Similar to hypothetical protein [Tuber melanosporum Mel28]; acc. no. XP_002840073 [Pyronema omphalodes CBS 100304]
MPVQHSAELESTKDYRKKTIKYVNPRTINLDIKEYRVFPESWNEVQKFRNCVVGKETFGIGDYLLINNASTKPVEQTEENFWVAQVLEIRAKDEEHVYLRVYWMYRPEELPQGRQQYHGREELIHSNHMDIIDARTVGGRSTVKRWREHDDNEENPSGSYWRQKFDYDEQTLGALREHCACRGYYNPDTIMILCDWCNMWLHEHCVLDSVKKWTLMMENPLRKRITKTDLKTVKVGKWDIASSTVLVKYKGRTWHEHARCLKCDRQID